MRNDVRSRSGKNIKEPRLEPDYQKLLANIRDGVYFTDLDRRITYWNKGAESITGYSAEEVVGRRCRDNLLLHVDDAGRSLCLGRCPLASTMNDKTPREAKVFLHHKQGHRLPVHVRATPLFDKGDKVVGAAEFFTDISTEETLQLRIQELENVALLDSLTQLPNRHHLEPELISRFNEMTRLSLKFGLLFMDIDHFKRFNDTYGHPVGDEVLRVVAKTLKSSVRPYDMVGRWGGEEFLCILRAVDPEQLSYISNRLRRLIRKSSIHLGEQLLSITVSMGATMATPADDVESLIKRADDLMYLSKKNGRDQVTVG
jgi:diguanylate cyclase (GGDEF)-like protein/PAS domain S-box-containing protein